jgi:tagatose 6-phosphate kinase
MYLYPNQPQISSITDKRHVAAKQMSSILVIGLNPALQKTSVIEKLRVGHVHRVVQRPVIAVGGKGQNFAFVSLHSEDISSIYLAQFIGGQNGSRVLGLIDSRIHCITQEIEEETRLCTTLVDLETKSSTEIIDPSPVVSENAQIELLQKLEKTFGDADIAGIALCGTSPEGVTQEFILKVLQSFKKCKPEGLVFLDGFKQVDRVLSEVNILKINGEELRALCKGIGLKDSGSPDFAARAKFLFEQFRSLSVIGLTNGPSSAFMFQRKDNSGVQGFEFRIPKVEHVKSAIGAGDTCGSTFFSSLLHKAPDLAEAFRFALSCASASCLTDVPGLFSKEDAKELYEKIEVSPL